jgi:hypothetical protein
LTPRAARLPWLNRQSPISIGANSPRAKARTHGRKGVCDFARDAHLDGARPGRRRARWAFAIMFGRNNTVFGLRKPRQNIMQEEDDAAKARSMV